VEGIDKTYNRFRRRRRRSALEEFYFRSKTKRILSTRRKSGTRGRTRSRRNLVITRWTIYLSQPSVGSLVVVVVVVVGGGGGARNTRTCAGDHFSYNFAVLR